MLRGGDLVKSVLFKQVGVKLTSTSITGSMVLPEVHIQNFKVGPLVAVLKLKKGNLQGGFQMTVATKNMVDLLSGLVGDSQGGNIVTGLVGKLLNVLAIKEFTFKAARCGGEPLQADVGGYTVDLEGDGIGISVRSKINDVVQGLGIPIELGSNPSVDMSLMMPLHFGTVTPRFKIEARDLGIIGRKIRPSSNPK